MKDCAKFYVMLNGKKTAISVDENGKLVIPHGVKKIGGDDSKCPFRQDYDRDSIYEIEFPDTLEEIEDFSLYACPCSPYYKKIVLPKSVKRIGRCAFEENVYLKYLETSASIIDEEAFSGCPLETIVLREGVKEIHRLAFNCSHLERIELPSTLEFLDLSAFDNIEDLKLPDTKKPIKLGLENIDSLYLPQETWLEFLRHCPEACEFIKKNQYVNYGDDFISRCKVAMVKGMKWRNETNGMTKESAKRDITLMHEFDAKIADYKREIEIRKENERIEQAREEELKFALAETDSPENATHNAFEKFLGNK